MKRAERAARHTVIQRALCAALALFFAAGVSLVLFRAHTLKNPAPRALAAHEQSSLDAALAAYNADALHALPYNTAPKTLPLACGSAVVFDAANGCVLYEKNPDALIPPASMTKLAVMYVVFEKIAAGEISFNDIVPLPPESWAVNALPGSSLMYLAQGQRVTLRELLLGMAVPSANDAAAAAACYVSGSVEQFCALMNQTMRGLGLVNTSFVDASGYSELNVTTPREFAAFLRVYLAKYGSPESQNAARAGFNGALEEFHSVKTFSYPQPRNAPHAAPNAVKQNTFAATNPALYAIEGCDGIKTGFIPESGYNLSLTVMRNGTRIAAVFMGGPGENTREGNRYRLHDAETVTRWAFDTFASRKTIAPKALALAVAGGTENALYLVPAHSRPLTVPAILPDKTAQEAAQSVTTEIITAPYTQAPITRGTQAGKIIHSLGGVVLEEIPLVADRTVEKGNAVLYAVDMLAKKLSSKIF